MNQKPIIALTPYFNTERDEPYMRPAFLKAVRHAGGIPVILPLDLTGEELEQLLEGCHGVLFTGGPDVHPFFFGEETQAHCGNVCLRRDEMEFALLKLAMAAKKPVLGVCRGVQVLNIGLGGDIYQDIPSQFKEDFPIAHTQPFGYDIPSHTVKVRPDTLLARIARCEVLKVNSMHHQAVRKTAPGLTASGHAPGGLVEAVEMPDYPFFLGVQWHPEYLWEKDPAASRLFEAFVDAARAGM
ncbi:MAG: gamma-glutamyl-gamma-aminobutyrate hydrolase family protein [Eubacteriales bacterium]|nr:gamma-glutamyl-gamma-aminobutyrate hydrolase family protein [Eubacteriales bacterium]